MKPEINARIRELRLCAEELRIAAESMKFRASRADLMAVAESYDRLADKLDSPRPEDRDAITGILRTVGRHK